MKALLLSDIHGNLAALEAVLEDAATVQYEAIWSLGDLVGYGPQPNVCIETLRSQTAPLVGVAGNHDWASLEKVAADDFDPDARIACEWTAKHLAPESRSYLSEFPLVAVEGEFTLVHGSPRQPIWEYILYPALAASNFRHFSTSYCVVGHTHIPATFEEARSEEDALLLSPALGSSLPLNGGRFIINPGSVAQPRDGDHRASYAILDTLAREVRFHRVAYPVAVTQEEMLSLGLPARLIARLNYGW